MSSEMPEIPYSELKEFYYHARLVMLGGDFGEKDLARLYIAIEINSMLAGQWYEQVESARNYSDFGGSPCPLCVWDVGEFISSCNLHEKINSLRKENQELLEVHQKITDLLSDYAVEHFETSFSRAEDMEELNAARKTAASKDQGSTD